MPVVLLCFGMNSRGKAGNRHLVYLRRIFPIFFMIDS